MDIIFGRENAEKLREKYTILDLETVTDQEGNSMEVFCLIPAEKLSLSDLPTLDQWTKLHNDFLNGYQTKQYNYCRDAIKFFNKTITTVEMLLNFLIRPKLLSGSY